MLHDFLANKTVRGPECYVPSDNSVLIVAGWLYSIGSEMCLRTQNQLF